MTRFVRRPYPSVVCRLSPTGYSPMKLLCSAANGPRDHVPPHAVRCTEDYKSTDDVGRMRTIVF